jgi:hypothetical protein
MIRDVALPVALGVANRYGAKTLISCDCCDVALRAWVPASQRTTAESAP